LKKLVYLAPAKQNIHVAMQAVACITPRLSVTVNCYQAVQLWIQFQIGNQLVCEAALPRCTKTARLGKNFVWVLRYALFTLFDYRGLASRS
jgi:hypothetical protein